MSNERAFFLENQEARAGRLRREKRVQGGGKPGR
jgi:hypothetical protein